jgi:hypothetical protein
LQRRSPRRAAPIAIVAACAGLPRSAAAVELPDDSDKALPCRPTVACTADIVSPGFFEIEAGGFSSRLGGGGRSLDYPFLLKQTLTPLLQIQVGSNGYTASQSSARAPTIHFFDNLLIGPKVHLVDQATFVPSLALSVQSSVPVMSSGGQDGALFIGYVSKDFGPIHADLNVGLEVFWGLPGADAAAQPYVALALSATLAGPLGVALEPYVFRSAVPYAARDGGIRPAITLTPRPWLVFDFGGDAGFFPSTRAYSLFAGMTVVPVTFWRSPSRPAG